MVYENHANMPRAGLPVLSGKCVFQVIRIGLDSTRGNPRGCAVVCPRDLQSKQPAIIDLFLTPPSRRNNSAKKVGNVLVRLGWLPRVEEIAQHANAAFPDEVS